MCVGEKGWGVGGEEWREGGRDGEREGGGQRGRRQRGLFFSCHAPLAAQPPNPAPYTLHPTLESPHPQPSTTNPKPQTLKP